MEGKENTSYWGVRIFSLLQQLTFIENGEQLENWEGIL